MKVTLFPTISAFAKKEVDLTWSELLTELGSAGPFESKAECPWIKLATFGDKRSIKNCLRTTDNVLLMTGITGDYDGGTLSIDDAILMCEGAGIKVAIYQSGSYTAEKPRWRILAPFDTPVPPDQYEGLVSRLNGVLGGALARESWVIAQSFYFGAITGKEYSVETGWFGDSDEGDYIDTRHDLDVIAIKPPKPKKIPGTGKNGRAIEWTGIGPKNLKTGDGRREVLKSIIGQLSADGKTARQIREELERYVSENFAPNDPPDWENIDSIIGYLVGKDEEAKKEKTGQKEPTKYEFIDYASVRKMPSPKWLIKGLFIDLGINLIYGDTGSGKSFISIDMGIALAEGRSWCGRRTQKRPVIYIVLEGEAGIRQRLTAWAVVNGRPPPDNFLVFKGGVPLDLRNPVDVEGLITSIKCLEMSSPVLLFDTLNQATPGMNENASEDMSEVIASIKYIKAELEGSVIIVHHTGKDATKGARGHSSLMAAIDGSLRVIKTPARYWEADKVKDGKDGVVMGFELITQDTGDRDDDGEIIDSCIVSFSGIEQEKEAIDGKKGISQKQRLIIAGFNTLADQGISVVTPKGERLGVPLQELVDYCMGPLKMKRSADIRRAIQGLIDRGVIGINGNEVLFDPN